MSRRPLTALALLTLASNSAVARDDDDDDVQPAKMDFAPCELASSLSATPGGAQDISYARDAVQRGEIPHPATFTPEGLFSEHDLLIPAEGACHALLCPVAAATRASLTVQPEVRYLAQLGFHTGIDAASFRRAPLNLVAVVDKSGSMSGTPLETVKASLLEVASHLGPDDQLSIVLYGDTVHTWLAPTRGAERARIERAVTGIVSAGSTDMESGLRAAFQLAKATAPGFDGATRVMLFTDERPNVGRTDAGSFMGMAEDASRSGVGLTTIGVGEQFGAELATKISSVRGGNLFFFTDIPAMKDRFHAEFDTMVTELAYDMELRVTPSPGLTLSGVYGLPGDQIRWRPDGSLALTVSTLFLSHDEGGIYFAFAPSDAGRTSPGPTVAQVALSYTLKDGGRVDTTARMPLTAQPPLGLTRGALLVEEATVLKQATTLHHQQNDQEGAWRLVHTLQGELRAAAGDADLDNERVLVDRLEATLAHLSGHQGETPTLSATRDPITGLPRR